MPDVDANGLTATFEPTGLGAVGQAFWDALTAVDRNAPELALIAEAARIQDRLRALSDVISAADITDTDGALQEARQQATALRQLIAQIEVAPAAKEASSDDIDFGTLRSVR